MLHDHAFLGERDIRMATADKLAEARRVRLTAGR
jgi:hypothetical protein